MTQSFVEFVIIIITLEIRTSTTRDICAEELKVVMESFVREVVTIMSDEFRQ